MKLEFINNSQHPSENSTLSHSTANFRTDIKAETNTKIRIHKSKAANHAEENIYLESKHCVSFMCLNNFLDTKL